MAGSLNKVFLIGRLGSDPEIKQMVNGKTVARLSLATSDSWKDKNTGERKEKTEWHRIVIFNEGLVNVVQQYLKKGAQIYIEGQLSTRKWKDELGNEHKIDYLLGNLPHHSIEHLPELLPLLSTEHSTVIRGWAIIDRESLALQELSLIHI